MISRPFPLTDQPSRPLRVLYVEDEPSLRFLVTSMLRREGYVVETAEDGVEGVRKVEADLTAYDLVITDLNMPRMNGQELIQRLREIDFPGKIVVFSATLSPGKIAELNALSVDAIAEKGTPAAVLLGAVAKLGLREVRTQ